MQCFYREAVSTRRDFIPLSISTTASLEAAWFGLSSCILFELRNQTLSLDLLFISEKEWDEMKDDLI